MLADLKAKAEGFDKKRIYTAVAALIVAGAAGHIMQRGAGSAAGDQALSASVPGTPQAVAPVVAAAGMIATPKPAVSAPVVPEPAEVATADPAKQMVEAVEIAAAPAPEALDIAPAEEPVDVALDMTPAPAPAPVAFTLPEAVTRSQTDPLLALSEAVSEPAADEQTALTEVPQDAPEDATIQLAAADRMTDIAAQPEPALPNCDIAFSATAQPGALVLLSLSAPCNVGENVEFDHAGLKFSEQLGPEGNLFAIVPAMTETATFRVTFADGQRGAAEATVPDFSNFERVAIMWKGATGLQLHALENGASYGEPGHVWAEAPADPEAAVTGVGGFISVLGSTSEGYAADIYTYPAGLVVDGPAPLVSVEAQVMENTCGGEISGDILRSNAGRAPTMEHLSMTVPGCDAVGEYLVLNNLPQDLKLARN